MTFFIALGIVLVGSAAVLLFQYLTRMCSPRATTSTTWSRCRTPQTAISRRGRGGGDDNDERPARIGADAL